jgi:hypothetical protein
MLIAFRMSAMSGQSPADSFWRLRVLVGALPGERHVQKPLLREVIDLTTFLPGLVAARKWANSLLESAQAGMSDVDFDLHAQSLANLIEEATRSARVASNDALEDHDRSSRHS